MPDSSQPATVSVLKVNLQRVRPPVWRRLEVPSGFSLGDLDFVIRTAFGWGDEHLHAFEANGVQYGDADTGSPMRALLGRLRQDEDAHTVAQVAGRVGAVLTYTYDFGDDWSHRVEVERVETADPQRRYPACTAGSGLAPEEDTGEMRPGTFGAEAREEINQRLRRLPGAGLGSELDAGEQVDAVFAGLFPALTQTGGACPCGCGETLEVLRPNGLPLRRPIVMSELAAVARPSPLLLRARALVDWLGAGRAVTPTKVLRPELGVEAVTVLDLDDDGSDSPRLPSPVTAVRSSKDLPSLHPLWTAAVSAGLIEIRSGKAVPGAAARRWDDQDGDDEAVQRWAKLAAGYLAAVYTAAAEERGPFGGMLEELLPASVVALYTAAQTPVPAAALGLAALDPGAGGDGLEALLVMVAAVGQYREILDHWSLLGVVRSAPEDAEPDPLTGGEQMTAMMTELRDRIGELASVDDPMVATLVRPIVAELEQTSLIELTALGHYALARLLTAHGWELPEPGDSAGDAPSEILDRLVGYSLADAGAEARVWLQAQGDGWAQAVREAAWSAAVKRPEGARRRSALPILLGIACAHEVQLLDQWQHDPWLGAHVAVTRQLLGGPEPTAAQQMWLSVDVLYADLGDEPGEGLDVGDVAGSGLEDLLAEPGGIEAAAATRHPEGRRVLLSAVRHLSDPELSRRLRKALGSSRAAARTGRREASRAGLRATR